MKANNNSNADLNLTKNAKPEAKIAPSSRVIFNPHRLPIVADVGRGRTETRRGLYAHYCYEYDEMLIDENDPEFANCLCGTPNPKT